MATQEEIQATLNKAKAQAENIQKDVKTLSDTGFKGDISNLPQKMDINKLPSFRVDTPDTISKNTVNNLKTKPTTATDLETRIANAEAQRAQTEKDILASMQTGQEEQQAQTRLRNLTQQARIAQEKARQSGETLGFASGETARVNRENNLAILAASENLKALTGVRENKLDVLKTKLGFEDTRFERLLGLQKEFENKTKEEKTQMRDNLGTILDFSQGKEFGELDENSQAKIKTASEELGIPLDGIKNALHNNAIAQKEAQENVLLERQLQLVKIAKEGTVSGDNPVRSFDQELAFQPALYGIPTQLINSVEERKRFEKLVTLAQKEGKTILDIQKAMLGFRIDEGKEPIANALLPYLQGLNDIKASDYQNTARLINAGQIEKAVTRLEKRLLDDTDSTFIEKQRLAEESSKRVDDIENLLDKVDPSDLGIFDEKKFQFKKHFWSVDQDVVSLEAKLVALLQPYRHEELGTAVTDAELKAISNLMASIKDQPGVLGTKIKEFEKAMMDGLNSARNVSGLPQTNTEVLRGNMPKSSLYPISTGNLQQDIQQLSNEDFLNLKTKDSTEMNNEDFFNQF